jgi:hypothetical protein
MNEIERLKKLKDLEDENEDKLYASYWLGNWETEILKNCIPRRQQMKTEEMVRWKLMKRKNEKTGTRTVWAWTLKNYRSWKIKSEEKNIDEKIN